MPVILPTLERTAHISACGTFRYHLSRTWDASLPRLCFVMLNPSTADHLRDDPTVKKCIAIAHHQGFGGIDVVNVFAFRSASPVLLSLAEDPVGPENDQHLRTVLAKAQRVVVAWGAHAIPAERLTQVRSIVRDSGHEPYCLRRTKDGQPCHPLARGKAFIPVNVTMEPFQIAA